MKTFSQALVFFVVVLMEIIIFQRLHGQHVTEKPTFPWSYKTEVGLNMTNLATRFIPLNFNNQSNQEIAFKYRKYRRTNAIKLDIGAFISGDEDNEGSQFITIGAGIEKRRNIWEHKWTYVSSFELNIIAAPIQSFIGIARVYGLEYCITPNVYVSTQTALAFGVNIDSGSLFRFTPPTSIFLNVRF